MSDEANITPAATEESVLTGDEDTGGVDESVLTGDEDTGGDDTVDPGEKPEGEKPEGEDANAGDDDLSNEGDAGYELPEGTEITDEERASVDELFSKAKLNSNQQQLVVDFMAAQTKAGLQNADDSYKQLTQGWAKECVNDTEFGGDKFEECRGIAKAAIDKFGTQELKSALNETGMSNHPDLFRFMVRVGKTLQEDSPGESGRHTDTPKSVVDELYPNDNNKKT